MTIHRLLPYYQQTETGCHKLVVFSFHNVNYYHKFVKKSLFAVSGCMFLVKNINSLISLNHIIFMSQTLLLNQNMFYVLRQK